MSFEVKQRRGRRIAMSKSELREFFGSERICRVATVSSDNRPHQSPLWFVFHGDALWLYSIVNSKRWRDVARCRFVSVLIDSGEGYQELRGAEIHGAAAPVGEVPRTGRPCPELMIPEELYAAKYSDAPSMQYDGHHAWLRVEVDSVVSWDFRKLFH